ncbi:MAG: hypothetical protein ACRYG2_25080 [Janthinobacterium lividum]
MARRRRAVERATFRRTVTDRVVAAALVLVALSGSMSILPGSSQRAVYRTACHVVTVGLGTCGAAGLDLTDTALAPARCPTLAALDDALPEVRVRHLVAARGLPVTVSTARSGDVVAQLGDAAQPDPPAVLDGQSRSPRQVADGVEVPGQTEWFLPRGQGLDELVAAAQDGEHQFVLRRSPLALLGAGLDRDERSVPAPTLLHSTLDLRAEPWPRFAARVQPPRTSAPATPRVPARSASRLLLVPDRPAAYVFNRVSGQSAVVATLDGTVGGGRATGTLRVTRDQSGAVVNVLVAVVAQGKLVPGEPSTWPGGPAVAYVQIPVRTASERAVVDAWLSSTSVAEIPLDEVLGLRASQPSDQLASFLTRAATVTVLRYGASTPATLQTRTADQLRSGRREEWDDRLIEAVTVAPTADGAGRVPVDDPSCRT